MSITIRWRLTVALLAVICISGVILVALLALGLADPLRVGALQWQMTSTAGWPLQTITPDLQFLQAPRHLPPDFTIELTTRNDGPPESAWGIQFWKAESALTILIDNQGYVSIGPIEPTWEQFLHVHPRQANTLYFHISPDGKATIRINEEIVRTEIDFPAPVERWGVVTYRQPQLAWSRIALYHQ